MTVSVGENVLYERLKRLFPAPAYCMIRSVRDAAGFDATRTADVLIMGIWKSRGLHLAGAELKWSRSDWLKELKDPAKAEQIARFCDKWWIVVPDPKIIKEGELPDTWGLIVAGEKTTKVVKDAPLLQPHPMPRPFLAAILRRYVEQHAPEADIARARAEGAAEARAAAQATIDAIRTRQDEEHAQLAAQVAAFEAASGLDIRHRWDMPQVGRLVRQLTGRFDNPARAMEQLAEAADRIGRTAREAATETRAILASIDEDAVAEEPVIAGSGD